MKIAIVASIWIKVPPQDFGFGAQEYLAYYLAEGLQKRGHDITLFATGDSHVSTRLMSVSEKQVCEINFPDPRIKDTFEMINLSEAYKIGAQFDLIHNHLLPYGLLFANAFGSRPTVHTLHHRIYNDRADIFLYKKYAEQNFVSISNAQRKIVPELNYVDTIYNGVDTNYFSFKEKPADDYLLFLGRMKKYKGIHTAIKIAKEMGVKLIIVSPMPSKTQHDYGEVMEYWNREIKPHIGQNIEYAGSIGGKEKVKLLQNAKALIFPIEREEPFGMTVIESMSCGTPIVAFAKGAIPEIVIDNKTGYLVRFEDGEKGLTEKVKLLYSLNENSYRELRISSRNQVKSKFDINTMVENYENLYKKML